MHRRGAGVGEQVQEPSSGRQFADASPRDAVVEEQSGVQVVGEIDQEAIRPLTNRVKDLLAVHLLVLLAVPLASPDTQCDPFLRQPEHLGQHRQDFVATAAGRIAGHCRRRGVLLHAGPALVVAVDVDGERVLRHVGVVHAVAGHVLAPGPGLQARHVLAQPVGEHLGPGPGLRRFEAVATRCLGIRLDRLGLQFETQQAALDRAVEERVRAVGAQAQRAAERWIAGEHARLPSGETLDQCVAQVRVRRRERLLVLESRTVRGIHQHEPARLLCLRQLRDVAALERQVVAEARAIGIRDRRADRGLVPVEAAEPASTQHREIATLDRGLAQRSPRDRVVLQPALESETTPQQAGREIRSDHRGLDHEGTRAAHRVGEPTALRRHRRPAATQQQRGGERLLQRCLDAGNPVAPTMQRVATQVDSDRGMRARKPQAHTQVRGREFHRRSLAGARPEPVHDRILGFLCRELAVSQPIGALTHDVDRQCSLRREMILPANLLQRLVHRLDRVERHRRNGLQHTARGARLQARQVGVLQRTDEAHSGGMLARHRDFERAQFRRQQVCHATRTGCEELVAAFH